MAVKNNTVKIYSLSKVGGGETQAAHLEGFPAQRSGQPSGFIQQPFVYL